GRSYSSGRRARSRDDSRQRGARDNERQRASTRRGSSLATVHDSYLPRLESMDVEERQATDSCRGPSQLGGFVVRGRLSGARFLAVARQFALEDLAGRVARELVDEHDLARGLVAGEVLLDVVLGVVL